MTAYATEADLYAYGVARGSVPNPGRLLAGVDVSANTITLDEHGLPEDQPFELRAQAGGTMPAPLVAGTTYYAKPVSGSVFQVRATAGGAAIDITTTGSLVLLILPLPIEESLEFGARLIDDMLPSHAVPLTAPYPPVIVIANAVLAGWQLSNLKGSVSMSLADLELKIAKRIERWGKGIAIRGTNEQTHTNLSVSAAVPYRDARGWNRFGGT